MSFIIYAPNVHKGGGLTLLTALLVAAPQARVIVDERLPLPASITDEMVILKTRPSISGRWEAERILSRRTRPGDFVLCFGNLPPIKKNPGRLFLFLQNRYLIGDRDSAGFPRLARLRIAIERIWLRTLIGRVEKIIVQSQSMAREVETTLGITPVILPFFPDMAINEQSRLVDRPVKKYDFLYVATPCPHKNHRTLVDAWVLLAKENLRPRLALTIDAVNAPNLVYWLEPLVREYDLHIALIGYVPHNRIMELYGEADALIYPSCFESLGLPLLEAASSGLPILAGELDYVRDIINPIETFDPSSPISIARAVKRYLHIPLNKTPVLTPSEFIDALLSQ